MVTSISNGESGASVRTKLNNLFEEASGLSDETRAIAETKAVTAVDVFVYDTSKDSDGGAWRKRTQGTSWYNETLNTATRGSRREFPAVAVIVAEASKVTIYDADDPTLPMWMVFQEGTTNDLMTQYDKTSAYALNGLMILGGNSDASGALVGVNFVSDGAFSRRSTGSTQRGNYLGTIAKRNAGAGWDISTEQSIVNSIVNDVAMTVLPDAPVDAATGLPVPTIAVATAGGISVIRDDGTVVNSASTRSYSDLAILDTFAFHAIWGGGESTDYFNDIRNLSSSFTTSRSFNSATVPKLNVAGIVSTVVASIAGGFVQGTNVNRSLNVVAVNPTDVSKSSVAYVTSTYNTGWMNGDIKGATLSDTDDTDLVGSGELVTNGTFDTDTSGWSASPSGTTSAWDASGYISVTGTATSVIQSHYQAVSTVVGASYSVSVNLISANTTNRYVKVTNTTEAWTASLAAANNENFVVGNNTLTFTATAATTYIHLAVFTTGNNIVCDNVSVKLADADRSVNNKGLIVNGTVTRSPVATGAELVGYSGFSYTDYLEQPYNSDLDFGTGDFCYMGWLSDFDNWRTVLWRGTDTATSFVIDPAGTTGNARINVGGSPVTTPCQHWTNDWRHMAVLRKDGVVSIYVNAVLQSSFSAASNSLTLPDATLRFGEQSALSGSGIYSQGQLALWRISATAPTAEQIKKIYEDEKVLFQENAAATLYGTSDAVTALAHDEDTGLLHVGTSAGRSVFQGLRRVSNTTTAVGTAISAANGMIAEE